jgi:hypothetical protein
MPASTRPPVPAGPPPSAAALRTYVVLAIGEAAGPAEFSRPLGTVAAPRRSLARAAARALYPEVGAECLRVLAAAAASTELLARALAVDGGQMLAGA